MVGVSGVSSKMFTRRYAWYYERYATVPGQHADTQLRCKLLLLSDLASTSDRAAQDNPVGLELSRKTGEIDG